MSTTRLPKWQDGWALFLDVDGTLLEIAATPAAVRVPPRALAVLTRLHERLAGALALVSGRSLVDLDRLFAPLRLPAAGAHGAERREASGRQHRVECGERLAPARGLLAAWAAAHGGALLEDKGTALALHYRTAPQIEAEARHAVTAALAAVGSTFHVQEGRMVLEIKAAAVSKGRAIEEFMREPPFCGRLPVFVGDDLTDESGFAAVNRLGGHSIAVGVDRATHAAWRFDDQSQVLDWLDAHEH